MTLRLADGERIAASRAVLTTGAWGAKLLPQLGLNLPLTANRQQLVYIGGLDERFAPDRFPVFLNLDHDFYGFPLCGSDLFKASIHEPGPCDRSGRGPDPGRPICGGCALPAQDVYTGRDARRSSQVADVHVLP